jgi:acyl carrier protein
MSREEIFKELKELIKKANTSTPEVLDSCTEESNLRGDLGLTSIGVLYLAISIEQLFDIEFNDSSFDDFNTVKDVVDYIEQNKK